MNIDSHQHFWRYTPAEYPWMKPEWPIRRDFLPPDLAREMTAVGLAGCVAVQAQQNVAEARWLLSLADAHPFMRN
jgi:L-fuconolactonase